jgi:1-acyl-sn-glycerol-3-phosphate acyltransferase
LRALRASLRLAGFAGWTAACFVAWIVSRAALPLSERAALRAHFAITRAWARGLARVSGMRVEISGRPPRPPFFLVCNHQSYVDIVVLWTELRGLFLAKSEIARWPVLGLLARSTGTLFIDRRRKSDLARVLPLLERALAAGYGVIVFPEGTSSAGDDVLPFKPSMFEVAARGGLPVYCAALAYATPPGSPSARSAVCWWGDMTFWAHLWNFLALPACRARLSFSAQPLSSDDRKELARRAWAAVDAEFRPLRSHAAA